jgi:hypothetical protein
MILMVNHPCGVGIIVVLVLGEGEGGHWSFELHFGHFFVVDLLNSYIDCNIKMCMYVRRGGRGLSHRQRRIQGSYKHRP